MQKLKILAIVFLMIMTIISLTACGNNEIPYRSRADIRYAINSESNIPPENIQ